MRIASWCLIVSEWDDRRDIIFDENIVINVQKINGLAKKEQLEGVVVVVDKWKEGRFCEIMMMEGHYVWWKIIKWYNNNMMINVNLE